MSESTFTSGQVARMLEIPARTIRAYLATGRLKATQNPVTGRWRVNRQQLMQFMRENGMGPESLERQARIFIVETDSTRHQAILEALSEGFWRLEVFDSCATALISMGAAPPDLLILDQWAVEDHCQELMDAIRMHERTGGVPILLLTAPERPHAELSPDAMVSTLTIPDALRPEVEQLLRLN